MFCAKCVLNAFTTLAPLAFSWRFSAELLVQLVASRRSFVKGFVTSTRILPCSAPSSFATVSSTAPYGTASMIASAHADFLDTHRVLADSADFVAGTLEPAS
jgi:hypothetical protein